MWPVWCSWPRPTHSDNPLKQKKSHLIMAANWMESLFPSETTVSLTPFFMQAYFFQIRNISKTNLFPQLVPPFPRYISSHLQHIPHLQPPTALSISASLLGTICRSPWTCYLRCRRPTISQGIVDWHRCS